MPDGALQSMGTGVYLWLLHIIKDEGEGKLEENQWIVVELEIFQLKRFLQENPHLLKLEISVGKCKSSENSFGGIR